MSKLRNFASFYSILVGACIILMWIMFLITGNVPELKTEPGAIIMHLIAEGLMALLLITAGIFLWRQHRLGQSIFFLASGTLLYSVINSSGYFIEHAEWPMIGLFFILGLINVILLFQFLRGI